jgi:hypothetical protein
MKIDKIVLGLTVLLGALALLWSSPAAAQDSSAWQIYLYNTNLKQLIGVNAAGEQFNYALNLPEQSYLSPYDMAFTSDGKQVAYCLSTYDQVTDGTNNTVIIADIASATTLMQVNLSPSNGCQVSKWNEDGTQIAVGLVRFPFGTPDPAAMQRPDWQLLIIDAATGQAVQQFDPSTSPVLSGSGEGARAYMPRVMAWDADRLVFKLIPWGTEAGSGLPAYTWLRSTGELVESPAWGNTGADSLPTGELIWLELDPAIASGEPGGPLPVANVLRLADASGEARTIYVSPAWILLDSRFVSDGAYILLTLLEPFNPAAPETPQSLRLVLLGRDGVSVELGTYPSFVQAMAAPGGYVILSASAADGSAPPVISYQYFVDGALVTQWDQVSDNFGVSWGIAWTPPVTVQAQAGFVPFPAAG